MQMCVSVRVCIRVWGEAGLGGRGERNGRETTAHPERTPDDITRSLHVSLCLSLSLSLSAT